MPFPDPLKKENDEIKRQMKFHCKQTRSGKLSGLNKFPLSPHIWHYILVFESPSPHAHYPAHPVEGRFIGFRCAAVT